MMRPTRQPCGRIWESASEGCESRGYSFAWVFPSSAGRRDCKVGVLHSMASPPEEARENPAPPRITSPYSALRTPQSLAQGTTAARSTTYNRYVQTRSHQLNSTGW